MSVRTEQFPLVPNQIAVPLSDGGKRTDFTEVHYYLALVAKEAIKKLRRQNNPAQDPWVQLAQAQANRFKAFIEEPVAKGIERSLEKQLERNSGLTEE